MQSTQLIVIVPVYKSSLNIYEELSFRQCLRILYNRPLSICTYRGLDISAYTTMMDNAHMQYSISYFNANYFRSADGYNELHLSSSFYRHYRKYEYMLIYQLDAFIFEDKVNEWIQKGFDYIGAPWLSDDGEHLAGVGNGGFCLKKIAWWYNELRWQLPVWGPREILHRFPVTNVRSLFSFVGRCWGYKNNVCHFYKDRRVLYNEDGLPALIANTSWRHKPFLPNEHEAIQFSFERFPAKLYELNHQHLPMGCHAWEKYEYESFWKFFIK